MIRLAAFYDTTSGAMKIGGVDVRDLSTEISSRTSPFFFQDVYLFNDTLRNNVLLARPDASDSDIEQIADLAGVTELVKRLPDGWDTVCGKLPFRVENVQRVQCPRIAQTGSSSCSTRRPRHSMLKSKANIVKVYRRAAQIIDGDCRRPQAGDHQDGR